MSGDDKLFKNIDATHRAILKDRFEERRQKHYLALLVAASPEHTDQLRGRIQELNSLEREISIPKHYQEEPEDALDGDTLPSL